MICYFSCRTHNFIPRMLRFNPCVYFLKKNIRSRKFSSALPKRYRDDKYDEIRSRLAAVPYLKMLASEEDRVRHDLRREKDDRLKDIVEWSIKVFDYNARSGKKFRTAALLKTFCTYGFGMDDVTWCRWDSDRWRAAVTLAWCVELLQASYAVLDDIMDGSVSRRGKPCWHTKSDVGLRAVVDGFCLSYSVYRLLHNHFAGSKYYMNMVHEFLQVDCNSIQGEGLDMMFNPKNQKPRFDLFTFERYEILTECKTSYHTVYLPVRLAMYLAGEDSAEELEFTRKLSLKLGMYYGIQNDYFDCFGQPEATGKIGNDIAEGKCTWFAVKFLEAATEPMKREFFENYGAGDKDAVSTVMELYRKTNLLERFEETEAQLSAEISSFVESRNDTRGALFYDLFVHLQDMTSKVKF